MGYSGIVQLILDQGANPNIVSTSGWTPLHETCQGGNTEVVELLLRKGADLTLARNKEGIGLLYVACSKSHAKITQLLLEKGADPKFFLRKLWPRAAESIHKWLP